MVAESAEPHPEPAARDRNPLQGCSRCGRGRGPARWERSVPDEQGHQRQCTDLPAPVAVHCGVETRSCRQDIGRVKMFTRSEYARSAILQADFHRATKDEYPLQDGTAVERAVKAHRTVTQLIAAARPQCRTHCLWRASAERDGGFFPKAGPAVSPGFENDLGKFQHFDSV